MEDQPTRYLPFPTWRAIHPPSTRVSSSTMRLSHLLLTCLYATIASTLPTLLDVRAHTSIVFFCPPVHRFLTLMNRKIDMSQHHPKPIGSGHDWSPIIGQASNSERCLHPLDLPDYSRQGPHMLLQGAQETGAVRFNGVWWQRELGVLKGREVFWAWDFVRREGDPTWVFLKVTTACTGDCPSISFWQISSYNRSTWTRVRLGELEGGRETGDPSRYFRMRWSLEDPSDPDRPDLAWSYAPRWLGVSSILVSCVWTGLCELSPPWIFTWLKAQHHVGIDHLVFHRVLKLCHSSTIVHYIYWKAA